MSNIVLAFIVSGLVWFFLIRKFLARLQTKLPETDVRRETVSALINGEEPKGEFIKVNKVEEYINNTEGEIKLGDVLEDEDRDL